MYKRSEDTFRGSDNVELYYQEWCPTNLPSGQQAPAGTLVITHGQAEHSECYLRLVEGIAALNWRIVAWDLRGHGRSEGKRGYAQSIDEYVRDMSLFCSRVMPKYQGHHFYLGHSLGGLIQMSLFVEEQIPHLGLAFSAPLFGLSVQVPKIKAGAAKLIHKLAPKFTLFNELKYSDLSRDPAIPLEYKKDPLRHEWISAGVFLSMTQAFVDIPNKVGSLRSPVLFQQGSDDRIVSREACEEVYEKIPSKNKQMKIYPGAYHEIYNDLCREEAYADLMSFINEGVHQ